jgi:hypothetical protein
MNRFVLKNTFIKVYIYHFLYKYFYNNKWPKLCFGDRAVVQNDKFYGKEGVVFYSLVPSFPKLY